MKFALRLLMSCAAIQLLAIGARAQETQISELMNLQLSLPYPIEVQDRGDFQILYNDDLPWQESRQQCSIAIVFNYETPKFGEEKLNGSRDAALLGDVYQFDFKLIESNQYLRPQEACADINCSENLFRVPIIASRGDEGDSKVGYIIEQNGQKIVVLAQDAPREILLSPPNLLAPTLIGARETNSNMSFRFREDDLQRGVALLKKITQQCASSDKANSDPPSEELDQAEISEFAHRIQQCWEIPPGVREAKIRVKVKVRLNRDGSVRGMPKVLNASKKPLAKAAAQSVVDAILKCQNYDFLPNDKYSSWQEITLSFDPNKY